MGRKKAGKLRKLSDKDKAKREQHNERTERQRKIKRKNKRLPDAE